MSARERALFALCISTISVGCSAVLGLKDVSIDDRPVDAKAPDVGNQDASKDGESKDNFVPPSDAADTNDACSADTKFDPQNCGYCGHDCLGGACNAGTCQPTLIAGSDYFGALAIDANYLYIGGVESLTRVSKDGTNPTYVASIDNFYYVLTDAVVTTSYIFMTVGLVPPGRFIRCPLNGCGGGHNQAVSFYNQGSPESVAVVGTNIFFSDYSSQSIYRCNTLDCGTGIAKQGPNFFALSFVTDGTTLFMSDLNNNSIKTCPLNNCTGPASTLLGVASPFHMSTDSQNLYVPALNSGQVLQVNKQGVSTPLASGQQRPFMTVVDGQYLYWTSIGADLGNGHSNSGTVSRCPITNCANNIETLVSGLDSPRRIVADDTAVYYQTSVPNASAVNIWRLAK